jgi:hypothetical protein
MDAKSAVDGGFAEIDEYGAEASVLLTQECEDRRIVGSDAGQDQPA